MATPRLSTNLSDEDPESTGQEVAWTAAVPLRGRATVAGTPGTGGRLLSTVLNGLKKYTTLLVLLILMALFSFVSPYFLTSRNLINIVLQNTYYSVNYETYICDGVEYPQIWANEVIIGPHIQPEGYFSNPAKLKNQP